MCDLLKEPGFQPRGQSLDPANPPRGGSGVPLTGSKFNGEIPSYLKDPPLTGVAGPVQCQVEGESKLTPRETQLVLDAVRHRLYTFCKLGVPEIEQVMDLPLDSFYLHCQPEAAALQEAGEKLLRLKLSQ